MTGSCPWMRDTAVAACAVRPVDARPSSGAFRARGCRDIAAIIGSEPRATVNRAFFHELPSTHVALDLRQIEMHPDDGSDQFKVGRALLGLIETWLDAAEKLEQQQRAGLGVEASAVLNALREVEAEESRDAPDSLIYRVARDDHGRLSALCGDPRVMLRRERQLCPLGRVRELDASCMRWLDMQPGRTIAEKAGTKQQVRSIVRVRSAATLENRVLRDVILRAQAVAANYCRTNSRFQRSTRVAAVRRFAREVSIAYEPSAIASVPALSGFPTPNYVLQNSTKYKYVWKTWLALVRKQQLTQSLLHWGGRWMSELALVGVLDALQSWEGAENRLHHLLTWRAEPHQGESFESAAPIGAYFGKGRSGRKRFDVARSSQLARGVRPKAWEPWSQLLPDFAVVSADADVPPLLVWSVVICDAEQDAAIQSLYTELARKLNAVAAVGLVLQFGGSLESGAMEGLQISRVQRTTDAPLLAAEALKQILRLVEVTR
jgi:hypothetical protein